MTCAAGGDEAEIRSISSDKLSGIPEAYWLHRKSEARTTRPSTGGYSPATNTLSWSCATVDTWAGCVRAGPVLPIGEPTLDAPPKLMRSHFGDATPVSTRIGSGVSGVFRIGTRPGTGEPAG